MNGGRWAFSICSLSLSLSLSLYIYIQVALEYAQKKYDDFAAIVQPFFSNAKSDNFTVDFVSYVSLTTCSVIHKI